MVCTYKMVLKNWYIPIKMVLKNWYMPIKMVLKNWYISTHKNGTEKLVLTCAEHYCHRRPNWAAFPGFVRDIWPLTFWTFPSEKSCSRDFELVPNLDDRLRNVWVFHEWARHLVLKRCHLRPEIDVVRYFEHQFEGLIHFKWRMIDLDTLILYRYLPHLSVRRKNPTSTFILCLSRYQMLGPEMPYSKRVLLNCTILALFNLFIPKNAHLFHSKVILS